MMQTIMSPLEGASLLVLYALAMLLLSVIVWRPYGDKSEFLLADRTVGAVAGGLSIAVTWIWAPALFVGAQKAYQQGMAGVFWFTAPNVACLLLFGWFAVRVRKLWPTGYTLSAIMRDTYSPRVHKAYLTQTIALAVCSFAVQLLAGGAVISALSGLPYIVVVVAMAGIALSYSLLSGFRASVATDYLQMLLVLVVTVAVVPWAISEAGGWDTVVAGLGGKGNAHPSLFDGDVAWSFGVAATIGLMAGPFGDQTFWQRAWGIRRDRLMRAFVVAAVSFAVIPIGLSMLGFLAAGSGMEVKSAQLVNLEVVLRYLPAWVAVPFAIMLISGLVSTLDSQLSAVSSIAGHDMVTNEGRAVPYGRRSMVALALVGVTMALIPGLKIVYLWLFYGTLRSATMLPTVMTVLRYPLSERGVFWGIVTAFCFGLPLFSYGNFWGGGADFVAVGSLVTVLSSGGVAWLMSRRREAIA